MTTVPDGSGSSCYLDLCTLHCERSVCETVDTLFFCTCWTITHNTEDLGILGVDRTQSPTLYPGLIECPWLEIMESNLNESNNHCPNEIPTQRPQAQTLALCDQYKDGLPLFREIYEMEDTKPKLLIKIIHFCQSWPGENLQQYQ